MKKDKYGFRFREWDIYKDSLRFSKSLKPVLLSFPSEERFLLFDQLKRALTSVTLNISEGCNKLSDKETSIYINRAQCSIDEIVGCLDSALLDEYINEKTHDLKLTEAASLAKRLNAFAIHLRKNIKK